MLKNILLVIFTILLITGDANATISKVHGFTNSSAPAQTGCLPSSNTYNGLYQPQTYVIQSGICEITSYYEQFYVPASGYYSLVTTANYTTNNVAITKTYPSNPVYLDSSKMVGDQNWTDSNTTNDTISLDPGRLLFICYYLSDANNNLYFLAGYNSTSCNAGPPLPPTPPIPDTNCTINDGSALSVSLGTLNRDEIPTVPDSGSAISKTISVVCTGGTLTANMQLNYTPISVGSNQAVKTSANGVGAAIFYDNKVLSPEDVTPVNFLEGSNTLTLGFQAVRDSTVALKDIPTGAFTANAVLVLTQQ
ncbi:fimbrial protein [Lelliottia amnigena]|uniref:fimbrial protein n=1 Tax=Lelliottia amnigena TaxID=61646 RepID=UPI001F2C951E|nr:fimbrial protein [Lelliottia amnigena]UJD93168.1 fimbrial protein [Lelliottia amnigena]